MFPYQCEGTVPFRMYSKSATDHFYTTKRQEKDNAVRNLGYSDEGVVGYVYPVNRYGAIPLYRAYSPGARDHFYTASKEECDNAVQRLGYVNEGISAYVIPT